MGRPDCRSTQLQRVPHPCRALCDRVGILTSTAGCGLADLCAPTIRGCPMLTPRSVGQPELGWANPPPDHPYKRRRTTVKEPGYVPSVPGFPSIPENFPCPDSNRDVAETDKYANRGRPNGQCNQWLARFGMATRLRLTAGLYFATKPEVFA